MIGYGCFLIAGFGDLVSPLFFSIACSFSTMEEAQNGVALQAIFAGRMEQKLVIKRKILTALPWSEEKVAYARNLEGQLSRECETRGLDDPTYDVHPSPTNPWSTGPC